MTGARECLEGVITECLVDQKWWSELRCDSFINNDDNNKNKQISKKKVKTRPDRCGNNSGRNCHAKDVGMKKICEFTSRDTKNVEHEMLDCTGGNWSDRNSKERVKEKFVGHTRETFIIFSTKESCTWDSTHNTVCSAV